LSNEEVFNLYKNIPEKKKTKKGTWTEFKPSHLDKVMTLCWQHFPQGTFASSARMGIGFGALDVPATPRPSRTQ